MSLSFNTHTFTPNSFIISLYNFSNRQCCLMTTLKNDLDTGKLKFWWPLFLEYYGYFNSSFIFGKMLMDFLIIS